MQATNLAPPPGKQRTWICHRASMRMRRLPVAGPSPASLRNQATSRRLGLTRTGRTPPAPVTPRAPPQTEAWRTTGAMIDSTGSEAMTDSTNLNFLFLDVGP